MDVAEQTLDIPCLPPCPLSVPSGAYAAACVRAGVKGGDIGAVERYRLLYRGGKTDHPQISSHLGALPKVGRVQESESGEGVVRKFTLGLGPAAEGVYDKGAPGVTLQTESVIIPMIGKKRVRTHTLCVSSQIGCAMGCTFCQTAQMGLVRNLDAREIVLQWFAARWMLPGYTWDEDRTRSNGDCGECGEKSLNPDPDPDTQPAVSAVHCIPSSSSAASAHSASAFGVDGAGCPTIRNVVFMGMGEPMDNLQAVIDAIAVLTDRNGANLPMSKVTISTVGRVDGLTRLAEQVHKPGWHRLNLAVSLNAPTDEIRAGIMPVNRRYSMSELRSALEAWPIYGAAKICLEYVMIPGVNDAREHATLLGDYVLGRGEYAGRGPLPGLVNLIPYNPREGSPWPAPEETRVDAFLGWVTEEGVYAKRRRTKGRDQMAACGQLGNLEFRRKRVGLTVSG